jgi:DNA polymerase-3 subunit alpha
MYYTKEIKAMSKFAHLHTHSHYSLLEALPKIEDLVREAKKGGSSALALTDSGNLYGAIEFYKECTAAEIKPIIGVDTFVAARTRFDKEARVDSVRSRLVLLAENETGYKNLLKLVTASYLEGFYYRPRVDRELLEKYSEGLIAIMPGANGEVVKALGVEDTDKASETLEWYKKTFGKDHFYVEITRHREVSGHDEKMERLANFAREKQVPLIAGHDIYYIKPDDKAARETLLSIQTHIASDDNPSFNDEDEDFSFVSPKQMEKNFKNLPEALKNVEKVVEMCNLKLTLGHWMFPDYKIESGKTADEELRNMVYEGFERRGVDKSKEMIDRVEYELNVIKTKHYAPYFLVVGDFMRFAHENGILSNIRGSVSGSLVTFLAGITNINPIEYDIPFERFLNPDRPSAPDIDMDFADDRRDEVIEYARKKYGADRVAQIGTFGTMMARGAVRDVARAMGFSYALGDQIAKLIPLGAQGFPMTIKRAYKESPDLKKLYESDPDAKTVLDMAEKIEGNARHISVHAAGVVIAPGPMTDYVPLQYDTKGENKIITQYDMYSVDEDNVGLLKFDFLGLRNLSIIADALDRIKKIEGKEIDLDKIPINDKKTFEMLARGETEGTFQLNGDAMTKFLMDLKPTTIHDINAMVALYRPGPMQFIPLFVERKHNPSLVKYLDPALKPILEKTYGVLVYQDDLLMIAREIAGYSWGEVDKFRKAVGKKIPALMAAEREHFIKGAMEHSKWSEKKATEVWAWLEPFAAYGFNKAHSVSYGRVAYITAYLKANFPEIYMSSVLTAESGDVDTIGIMVNECKRMGIVVLPPSVNESFSQFTVVNDPPNPYKIRFGLVTIKNFGQGVSTAIIEERKRGGKFTSLIDFLDRIKDKNLNRKSLESLIKTGALDEFGDRGVLMANLDNLLSYHKEHAMAPTNQASLFGLLTDTSTLPSLRLINAPLASQRDKLAWERELLGLYISGHPLEEHHEKMSKINQKISKLSDCNKDDPCVIAGLITEVRDVLTKGNERMVFLKLEDLTGHADVVLFPKVFEEYKSLVTLDNCIAVKGRISKRNGETSLLGEKIKAL